LSFESLTTGNMWLRFSVKCAKKHVTVKCAKIFPFGVWVVRFPMDCDLQYI
jgi:hypothetical protein